jgi:dTMP kinase
VAGVRQGTFITFEGPDGAGKSTQIAALAERLHAVGEEVVATREPGGTAVGELIRGVLLGDGERDPLTDALLFNAARRQIVVELIRPALARGAVVVCDRFADSTLAYQGYGSGVHLDRLRALADIATDGLQPDRTILLDLASASGLRRRAGGAESDINRFESADEYDLQFHTRVREAYLDMATEDPQRWRVVDAGRDPRTVADDVWQALSDLFA